MQLRCKRGWTLHYYHTNPNSNVNKQQQLRGCALCGRGRFATADPSESGGVAAAAALLCQPCPIGNYSDRTDAIGRCTPCGAGLTTLSVGSTSPANCTCPPGMGRDPLTQKCTGCSLYEYQTRDSACARCPDPNMLTTGNALSVEACLCGPGFARKRGGVFVCIPCSTGTYSATASAATACTRCAAGQTTLGMGARSKTACACDAQQGFVQVSGGLCRNSSLLIVVVKGRSTTTSGSSSSTALA